MKIYRIDEVAEMFGCSTATLRRWIRNGIFPSGKKIPGGMIWTETALERWAEIGQASTKEMKMLAGANG